MNIHSIIAEKSVEWLKDCDLDLQEFDVWMTRHLNCLVAKHLDFVPQVRLKNMRDAASVSAGQMQKD